MTLYDVLAALDHRQPQRVKLAWFFDDLQVSIEYNSMDTDEFHLSRHLTEDIENILTARGFQAVDIDVDPRRSIKGMIRYARKSGG